MKVKRLKKCLKIDLKRIGLKSLSIEEHWKVNMLDAKERAHDVTNVITSRQWERAETCYTSLREGGDMLHVAERGRWHVTRRWERAETCYTSLREGGDMLHVTERGRWHVMRGWTAMFEIYFNVWMYCGIVWCISCWHFKTNWAKNSSSYLIIQTNLMQWTQIFCYLSRIRDL